MLLATYWTPQFQEWLRFVLFDFERRFEDPLYRAELRCATIDCTKHPEIYIFEYYALIGTIRLMREAGSATLYQDFEYLNVLCTRWLAAHPRSTYPRCFPRFGPGAAPKGS